MKIIDAHMHFVPGDRYFSQTAQAAGEENTVTWVQNSFAQAGIVGAVIMGNRSLSLKDHQYPPGFFYCIGIDRQTAREMRGSLSLIEQHLRRPDCVGVKLYPGYNKTYVTDPIYAPLYVLASRYRKPVAIHTGETANPNAYLKYCHPLTLDELAAEHPDVEFIMCHFGNPFLPDAAAVVSKNPNVSADLSGLLEGKVDVPRLFCEQGAYIEQLRAWTSYTGYEKLMFGTDWPLSDHGGNIEFFKRLIPQRHWDAFFYENARRIYGLPVNAAASKTQTDFAKRSNV